MYVEDSIAGFGQEGHIRLALSQSLIFFGIYFSVVNR